ncbi:MAG: hypothetical protein J3K34DRAFT_411556 [Monoraphidium minutum]|nr:MAG: hypothetical protein J3K34DRAFT_411556 [Monoraphidium minutum]
MAELAEANLSAGARQARELRRQQQALAGSMEALKQQGSLLAAPGGLDPGSAKARGAPVPEKAWAARNVARSLLAAGGEAGVEEGARMLREAAAECAGYYGDGHPGQLSTLLDLVDALMALQQLRFEAREEAADAIRHALAIVEAVGERYRAQGDLMSLVLLYESAQAELDYPQACTARSAGGFAGARRSHDMCTRTAAAQAC